MQAARARRSYRSPVKNARPAGASAGGSAAGGRSAHGAVVNGGKSFPDNSLIVGSPARVIRTLDDKATAQIRAGADIYVQRSREYAKGLKRVG